ncbi:Zn-dependent protease [Sinobacterium caligoides]|uniref:Zn-dependent protease n=1 Tax=Sinobacterium caligoides TaxID=933926 RepID=A0A3N2DP58_9GAMM|nr:site-2 protease family protein [Sinobacterium caligoides]ROS01439.1 Zn-dependent protease [Sinobacterium caligoides]
MQILCLSLYGRPLTLEASMAGWQQLSWGSDIVSQLHTDTASNNKGQCEHSFILQNSSTNITCKLIIDYQWRPMCFNYRLLVDEQEVDNGSIEQSALEQVPSQPRPAEKTKPSFIGLISLAFKLLKSAKVIKVVLAGASLAAYSWLFSIQFALALIACLVFHEYGHVRAMKHFGMRTKGIYLIPFIGGLAVSDEKISSRWQDVAISLMGPVFGLIMSIACLLLYWLTDNLFFAGLSTFSALLNLFNLLPILPLDGGHVLKSISFSLHSYTGLTVCIITALAGVLLSHQLGLHLLTFLLIIGSLEILLEWKNRYHSHLIPLDRYGQLFSASWYFLTVAGLVGIIYYFAGSGDAILGLPLQVLQS